MQSNAHKHDVYIHGAAATSTAANDWWWWEPTTILPDVWRFATPILLLAVTVWIYKLLWSPLNRIRDMSEVGFGHLTDDSRRRGISQKLLINEVRARKKLGDLPPVYPNGWFAIIESSELPRGGVKAVEAVGQHLAVFRTEAGDAHILDAYCPHLGANLGVGGKVRGSCIECPFHGWRFDGKNGECVQVPYAEKVPSFAKVKKWQCLEQSGWIYTWFHAEGEEPSWMPPPIEEVESGKWVYRGRTEHVVNAHIQDISENGSDVAHLAPVHTPCMFAGVDLRYMYSKVWEFAQHYWNINWKEEEAPNTHLANLELHHTMKIFGKIPIFTLELHAKQVGPAINYLEMRFALGRGVLIQTATPIAPLEVRFIHRFYASRTLPAPYCKVVLFGEAVMVERDIMVWNSKTYASKPVLVKEDKLLSRHRRWYQQFYSENSPKLKFNKDAHEW